MGWYLSFNTDTETCQEVTGFFSRTVRTVPKEPSSFIMIIE
jgi:hypothetical protein